MKQPGNLAIVCARRKDVALRIEQGRATLFVNGVCKQTTFSVDWDDDETILSMIAELNFGCGESKSQWEPRNGRRKLLLSTSCGN